MNDDGMVGRDVYLRYDGGPVQHFRAWNAHLFIEKQVEQGIDNKDKAGAPAPIVVKVATREEYAAERSSRRRRV